MIANRFIAKFVTCRTGSLETLYQMTRGHRHSYLPHRQLRKVWTFCALKFFSYLPHRQLRKADYDMANIADSYLPHRQLRKPVTGPSHQATRYLPHRQPYPSLS